VGCSLLLIWDYDTPTGFDVSRLGRDYNQMCEYHSTDRILELLARHNIVSTFACVGTAAEPGPLPYHNPAQIRAIHQAGHEIASHSHRHEYLPGLTNDQLMETLYRSKAALEDCISGPVNGFVSPWNRPIHHPIKLAISLSERQGWGWRHSVASLCHALSRCGYRWARVAYTNVLDALLRRFGASRRRLLRPAGKERYANVHTLRQAYLGFDKQLRQLLPAVATTELAFVIWAHPHGIEHDNAQNWSHLVDFVTWWADQGRELGISFNTPNGWLQSQGISAEDP
jgi:peptidoglycan/xylan/chitin deacetylase (PgdA/CDA1 family)